MSRHAAVPTILLFLAYFAHADTAPLSGDEVFVVAGVKEGWRVSNIIFKRVPGADGVFVQEAEDGEWRVRLRIPSHAKVTIADLRAALAEIGGAISEVPPQSQAVPSPSVRGPSSHDHTHAEDHGSTSPRLPASAWGRLVLWCKCGRSHLVNSPCPESSPHSESTGSHSSGMSHSTGGSSPSGSSPAGSGASGGGGHHH